MKIWDSVKEGSNKLDDKYFDDWFEVDFTNMSSLDGVFGLEKGWHTTDGLFKLGDFKSHVQSFATSYQYPNSTNQRNLETQYYTNPLSPDPLHNYSLQNGRLICSGYQLDTANDWARVKGFATDARPVDGRWEMTIDRARQLNIPLEEWGFVADGDRAYFHNMPASHVSAMFSTQGRARMSFGRYEIRLSMDTGAAGAIKDDITKTTTAFPAAWLYHHIDHMCDLNGDYNGSDPTETHTPGNIIGNPNCQEFDLIELFGYQTKSFKTTLHYFDKQQSKFTNVGKECQLDKPCNEMMTIGVDLTPGKMFIYVDGKIICAFNTPDTIASPLNRYALGSDPYNPQLPKMKDGKAVIEGIQTYSDGSPKYTMWSFIVNMAFNAVFTRYFSREGLLRGNDIFPYKDPSQLQIEYIRMSPLAVDNPDQHRVAGYESTSVSNNDTPIEIKTQQEPLFLEVTDYNNTEIRGRASKNFIGRGVWIPIDEGQSVNVQSDQTFVAKVDQVQSCTLYISDSDDHSATYDLVVDVDRLAKQEQVNRNKIKPRKVKEEQKGLPIDYVYMSIEHIGTTIVGTASEHFIGRGVWIPLGKGYTAIVQPDQTFSIEIDKVEKTTRGINAYIETINKSHSVTTRFDYIV